MHLPRRPFLAYLSLPACLLMLAAGCSSVSAPAPQATLSTGADGWAGNSVNTVVFRKNALVSDASTRYIAFYDRDAHVVLGNRRLASDIWETRPTPYRGNARDAHNAISVMLDGAGYPSTSARAPRWPACGMRRARARTASAGASNNAGRTSAARCQWRDKQG